MGRLRRTSCMDCLFSSAWERAGASCSWTGSEGEEERSFLHATSRREGALWVLQNTVTTVMKYWENPTFSVRVPFIVMAVLTKSIISSSSRISWYFSCSCLIPCSRSFLAPKLREAVFSLSSSQRPCSPPSSMGVSSSSRSLWGTSWSAQGGREKELNNWTYGLFIMWLSAQRVYLASLLLWHVVSVLPLLVFLGACLFVIFSQVPKSAFVLQLLFLPFSQLLCRKKVLVILDLCFQVLKLLFFSLLQIFPARALPQLWQLKEKKIFIYSL